MRKVISIGSALGLAGALLVGSSASAAPIYCPPGQEPTKGSQGHWYCMNNGNHESGAGWHKGNDRKL